jgi:8-oxo-dGTP diphosphatase
VSDQPSYSVSVAGVVVDSDGRVLVIKRRDNGDWQPPGGILEIDETIEHGVQREVREETGLHVEPEVLTGVYKNMPRGIVSMVFRCRVLGGTPHTTDESQAVRWIEVSEVTSLISEAFAVRILDSINYAGAPAVREHDGIKLL